MKIEKYDETEQKNSVANEFADAKSFSLLSELWDFIKANKAYWIVPAIIVILLLAGVVALGMIGGGAMAPFIYTIF